MQGRTWSLLDSNESGGRHDRVNLADANGKNYYGYWTPGFSITLPGDGLFNAGYSIGNDSWKDPTASDPFHNPKNRYVFLYYGVTF